MQGQTNSKIKVISVGEIQKFKLIVFAKDVLIDHVGNDKTGYNYPQQYLNSLEPDPNYETRHIHAYVVINIYLSDGSATNPYLVNTADDFWSIDDKPDGFRSVTSALGRTPIVPQFSRR